MAIYPVIMCGGGGARLWPTSRPSRPKQFIPLSSNRSLFQEAALRTAPLAGDGGRLIVVGGVVHRESILEQLEEIGVDAQLLLEPEPRDSAAAMAAAAVWTVRIDPEGVNAFFASDHHIPDADAFQAAVLRAAAAATEGRIVTLGVRPTEPSAAYGYIAPQGPDLSPVRAFVEKPDAETAARYIAEGYLWNSGNFIVRAQTLLDELVTRAPAVERAARAALPPVSQPSPVGGVATLTAAFSTAPKISIDYAVMEKTRLASVLAVDFEWSDLGAWDAVAASGEGELGQHIFEDSDGCMVRATDGVLVAAIGVHDLAIVVEKDAVLVCDLARSQDVKKVVERLKKASPRHLDFPAAPSEGLMEGARRLSEWLRMRGLPVWSSLGQDEAGGFVEVLGLDGRPVDAVRRARVQPRQIQVFADAGRLGWNGPWRGVVARGLERMDAVHLRPDGLMRALTSADGTALDETALIYDQAFMMFARAAAHAAGLGEGHEAAAASARDRLLAAAPAEGGLVEQGEHPYQSNAHMHLLEASLAWEGAGGDAQWSALADRIVAQAHRYFIDVDGGFVREFFSPDWSPAAGDHGRLVEPGHQFEWAWLLARYGRSRGDTDAIVAARRLYAFGLKGVGPRRQVAIDALNADGSTRSRRARLWPQTEWLKAALILAELSDDGERTRLLADAATAQRALWRYLTPEGLWRDKLLTNGTFIDEPAPASSFYHVMAAFSQLEATTRALGLDDGLSLRLD